MPRRSATSQRIVSLVPSVTSILVAIGARKSLVGVSKWCREVADVDGQPRLGDCWTLDVGEVTRLRPTLVIGGQPYKPETVRKLLDTGVTFLATNPRSLEDIFHDIEILGGVAGRGPAAERLVRKMRAAFTNIQRRGLRRAKRPRVYCEAWPKPRISSPPWVAELVEIAGGKMVVPAGHKLTDEQVAGAEPEIIVIAWTAAGARPQAKTTLATPLWQDVPAIRNRQVHIVSDELLNTPGPPLMQGLRELRRIIRGAKKERP